MARLRALTSSSFTKSQLKRYFRAYVLLAGTLVTTSIAVADTTFVDSDTVVLTIQGKLNGSSTSKLDSTNNAIVEFDMASLVAMDATTFTTSAPWTANLTEYTGVRISILLKIIGARSNQFEAIADNDYKFTLNNIDFDKYPVIIAYKKNGQFFSARQLGPLLIMFPFDDFPELITEKNKASSVWQLIELRLL